MAQPKKPTEKPLEEEEEILDDSLQGIKCSKWMKSALKELAKKHTRNLQYQIRHSLLLGIQAEQEGDLHPMLRKKMEKVAEEKNAELRREMEALRMELLKELSTRKLTPAVREQIKETLQDADLMGRTG